MREVTDASFEQDVLASERPVVVDFWAPWCGPCRAIAPLLQELADESGRAEFVKLDIDENPETAARYSVLSIPTVIVFEGGEARQTVVGARPKRHFARAFEPYL